MYLRSARIVYKYEPTLNAAIRQMAAEQCVWQVRRRWAVDRTDFARTSSTLLITP